MIGLEQCTLWLVTGDVHRIVSSRSWRYNLQFWVWFLRQSSVLHSAMGLECESRCGGVGRAVDGSNAPK